MQNLGQSPWAVLISCRPFLAPSLGEAPLLRPCLHPRGSCVCACMAAAARTLVERGHARVRPSSWQDGLWLTGHCGR